MTVDDSYFHSIAARYEWGRLGIDTQPDFGPAWALDNPSGFRAYTVFAKYNARHEVHYITDLYGKHRWLNGPGYRIMLEALRLISMGVHTTSLEMAELAHCHRSTVARWLEKLTAWGVLGAATVRGKYGGIVLWARTSVTILERFAVAARDKIRARYMKRNLNAHPSPGGGVSSYKARTTPVLVQGAHLDFERDKRLSDALGCDPNRGSGRAPCPAHGEGRSKTLSWKRDGDRLLVHCFAGCTYKEIREAAGV